MRGFVWEFVCEGYPLKEQMTGKMRGILVGTSTAKDTPEREKMTVACAGRRLGKVGGKVAEIEFFQIECHAENGHLSADKWTKIVDKVFDLKKTITTADTV